MISLAFIGVGLGIGLVIIGAGIGIGRIGEGATQGISRQPESSGAITVAMIISAALIEGAALFALVIGFQMSSNLNGTLLKELGQQQNTTIIEEQGR